MTKRLPSLAFLALLALTAGGCVTNTGAPMSMAAQIHLARQTHTSAMAVANNLIESGVIKSQADKDAIWEASEEVYAGINAAEAQVAAGNKPNFDFWMGRVQSALDRLVRINAQHRQRSGGPTTRRSTWTPSRLPASSSLSASSWPSSPASSRSWRAARSSLPRTRLS